MSHVGLLGIFFNKKKCQEVLSYVKGNEYFLKGNEIKDCFISCLFAEEFGCQGRMRLPGSTKYYSSIVPV